MKAGTVAVVFLLGVCFFQSSRTLPSYQYIALLAVLAVFYLRFRLWALSLFLIAFLWSAVFAHWSLSPVLAKEYINQPLRVELCINEVRKYSSQYTRFLVRLKPAETAIHTLPDKALVSWYRPSAQLLPGQCLEATVKFKPPHGFASDGAFDRETWYYLRGIGASGVVQSRYGVELIDTPKTSKENFLQRINKYVQKQFTTVLFDSPNLALLIGLATGDRSHLQPHHWNVLQHTGTSHLLAISGLHIGAIALVFYLVALNILKRSTIICRRIPAQRLAALFALAGAFVFAMLSGFAVPAQRALIMLAVFTVAMWMRRRIHPGELLAIACVIVLALDPRQVLTAGFWFSFAAVAVIILSIHFSAKATRFSWFIKLQLILSASAFSIALYYFGTASIAMPIANFIAVPVISFVVLPLLLIALFFVLVLSSWLHWPLLLADSVIHYLWLWLEWLATIEWAVIEWQPAFFTLVLFHIAIVLVFMLQGWKDRWLALLFAGALFLPEHRNLSPGQFRVAVLDVGQGLAVVVQTSHHVLVYDAGPRYGDDFDTGNAVVIPYLQAKQLTAVDLLIVSHNDIDHRGGAASLVKDHAVKSVISSQVVAELSISQKLCSRTHRWQWDGVDFEFLHPDSRRRYNRNNGSCVLKISSPHGDMLLTGDIERSAERELVSKLAHLLPSEVVTVPHHGSQTSSSERFLNAVSPKLAVNSAGFLNQYGFPHPFVQRRYTHHRIPLLNTAELGTIELLFSNENRLPVIASYRQQRDRYWHWSYLRHYH